jgi:pyridoxal phosphate enzyme (YggS family)
LVLIADNLATIRNSIGNADVVLIAVTKTQSVAVIRDAVAAGLTVVGENRVQEAIEKAAQLRDLSLEWHLIGHLQTNKVKQAVALFSLIHSVDSERLACEIDRCARLAGKVQNVLIQVNVAGEESKSGIAPSQAEKLALVIDSLPNLRLCGAMTIAPLVEDAEMTRPVFREMRILFEQLREKISRPEDFRWLSMGMTHDYRIAVSEGANMIRIGTGLFGARTVR